MAKKSFVMGMLVMALVFGAVLAGCVSGPELSSSTKYEEVIDVPDVSKGDLFTKVNMWMVDAFNNADSVIQYSDKESGVLKGKYTFTVTIANLGIVGDIYNYQSTLTIEVRDGRCRVSFADPNYEHRGGDGRVIASNGSLLRSQSQVDEVIARWKELVDNLKTSLSSKAADW
jgi:hypothetical protein